MAKILVPCTALIIVRSSQAAQRAVRAPAAVATPEAAAAAVAVAPAGSGGTSEGVQPTPTTNAGMAAGPDAASSAAPLAAAKVVGATAGLPTVVQQ